MHYAHLTQAERHQIELGVQAGLSEREVDWAGMTNLADWIFESLRLD